jgi:hypothetical protein
MSDVIHLGVFEPVVSGTLSGDQTICYNTTPATITSSAATGGNGSFTYQWEESDDKGQTWNDVTTGFGETTENYSPAPLTDDMMYRLRTTSGGNGVSCGMDYSASVTITVLPQSLNNYPDVVATVCPNISAMNLNKFIDPSELKTISWTRVAGATINSDGTVTVSELQNNNVHTYKYKVTNTCVSSMERKFYLRVLNDNKPFAPIRDTIRVCHAKAEALHMNQILGIDADGSWVYPTELDINNHIRHITIDPHTGALIFNGKTAYADTSIPFTPQSSTTKNIVFEFTPIATSCLAGKQYVIVIALGK